MDQIANPEVATADVVTDLENKQTVTKEQSQKNNEICNMEVDEPIGTSDIPASNLLIQSNEESEEPMSINEAGTNNSSKSSNSQDGSNNNNTEKAQEVETPPVISEYPVLPSNPTSADKPVESVLAKTDSSNQKCVVEGNNDVDKPADDPAFPGRCYCDRDRDLNAVELQCGACFKWFHQLCITIPIGKCLPFMVNYTFVCKNCNPAGTESFMKRQSNFPQICLTTIANLMQESISIGKPKTLFSRDKEIIPFIDRNWPFLTTMQRRVKQTWHNTVQKTMLKESDIFVCEESLTENSLETQQLFGIVMQDLYKIGPDYENKFGHNSVMGLPGFNQVGKSRGAKRKVPSDNFATSASKKPKSDLVIPKLPPHGYPVEHPFNKDGYRYILAEPDPHAPFRQEFDESSDWAGKPIPGWLYRTLVPNSVLLAMHDRGPQLKISEDRLSVIGEKGYCMARGTHGVSQGSWYFECVIEDMPEGSATRIGWSQSLGNLQAPLGFDKFGYSWRSRKGTKFHQSIGRHYVDGGYSQGDVLGFLINLPPQDPNMPTVLPPTYKEKPLVKFRSYLYFEEKDEVQLALKELKPLPKSKITYFKNGKCMGVAWEDIFAGIYYPAISLYKSCTVAVNFGPNLKCPPVGVQCRYMYEAAHKALIEQTVSDLVYFTENDGKLRLDSFMS